MRARLSSALGGLFAFGLALSLGACSTYHDDLARGQHAFEENQHERAMAIFRVLEPDAVHLSSAEQTRYCYLRGMTDFRIGYKADARHWLAVAKAMDDKTPGQIPPEWRSRLEEALKELDAQVYASGMESLQNATQRRPSKRDVTAPKTKPADDTADEGTEEEEESPKTPPKKKKRAVEDED